MVDAVHVLCSAGATHAAYLPARAAVESSLFLDWILYSDTDKKARYYIVGNYRDERRWARRAIKGTDDHAAWSAVSNSLGVPIREFEEATEDDAKARLADVDRVLAQDAFRDVDD